MSALDELLDLQLDDLEDLPSFQPFPIGAHRCLATFGTKEISGKPTVTLEFKMLENIEMANSQDEVPKEGDTCGTIFMLDNEYGRGNLKKVSAPFMEALGFKQLRELVEGAKDVEVVLISGLRVDKNDPDKKYIQVKEIQVV